MTIGTAISECMRKHRIKDEQVAIWTDSTAQTVRSWRTGESQPNATRYQMLRQRLPDFAAIMDEATSTEVRRVG